MTTSSLTTHRAFLDEMQKIADQGQPRPPEPMKPAPLDPNRPLVKHPLLRFGARTGGTILAGVVGTGLGMLAGKAAVEGLRFAVGPRLERLPPEARGQAMDLVMQYGPGVLTGVASILAYEQSRKKRLEDQEHLNAGAEYKDNVRRLRERSGH